MKFSDQSDKIIPALLAAQLKAVNPKKAAQGYNYMYADLDAVMDSVEVPMRENGLMLIHSNGYEGAAFGLFTRAIHAASGQWVETFIPIDPSADPQDLGAEITYYRRYSVTNLFRLVAEDDTDAAHSRSKKNAPGGQNQGFAPRQPVSNQPSPFARKA